MLCFQVLPTWEIFGYPVTPGTSWRIPSLHYDVLITVTWGRKPVLLSIYLRILTDASYLGIHSSNTSLTITKKSWMFCYLPMPLVDMGFCFCFYFTHRKIHNILISSSGHYSSPMCLSPVLIVLHSGTTKNKILLIALLESGEHLPPV